MSEKEIVEVFVRVQEPEYYDRIMLLVGAKFAEIVKVGLMKKKREDVSSICYKGKKAPRKSSSYQGRSRPLQNSYPTCHAQADYQNIPPPIYQTPPNHYRNIAPNCANVRRVQTPPPTYQTPAPLYQNTPPNYQPPQPNYQTNPYPRHQAPRPNAPNYRQMPPPQQCNYDPPLPVLDLRKSLPEFSLR
ncbi:hypothetical protein R3W88_022951 [Solanum pinnatisectum]|uniref:Uncharacterized protein n=1 Tax=Solanum pinnatisectum TaxID=50273 RepID=A0AAV9LWV4_9SOLN|nr:hypothetical protein R3W88_022951 [Solanum pinnatisectum]